MLFQNYTTDEHSEVKSAVLRETGSYVQMHWVLHPVLGVGLFSFSF